MDDTTREAVEFLEWWARPHCGLRPNEQKAVYTVLDALAEAERRLAIYRKDRREWKEATLFQRYSMTKPSDEEFQRIGRFVFEHPSLENAAREDGQE
jgi:hypothetical protein